MRSFLLGCQISRCGLCAVNVFHSLVWRSCLLLFGFFAYFMTFCLTYRGPTEAQAQAVSIKTYDIFRCSPTHVIVQPFLANKVQRSSWHHPHKMILHLSLSFSFPHQSPRCWSPESPRSMFSSDVSLDSRSKRRTWVSLQGPSLLMRCGGNANQLRSKLWQCGLLPCMCRPRIVVLLERLLR